MKLQTAQHLSVGVARLMLVDICMCVPDLGFLKLRVETRPLDATAGKSSAVGKVQDVCTSCHVPLGYTIILM